MEAASTRYATRDRFGSFGEPVQTPLQRYIRTEENAVDPQNYEPNLALNLEVADLINSKKGNAPREAAVAIVNYINHRNHNVQLLALSLLDICVKNCGYPFHLQISTKEFLNELVRRFPERPPLRPTRVQLKILEAIEEWRQTICQTSRYKEDLGFIRDMHRLLSYKGYVFPEIRKEDAAVLNPSDNLQSADEMEEEERAAQSAKLQELIRRGGPQDLQEANRLMKVMAGYDTKHRTDYRAKAAEEVGKIQQKAKLLEERLQNFKPGDAIADGDIFEELASALQNAQPKIQKMCEEESDDQEAVAKLFEINDSIHRTIERYRLIKKGDVEGASKIPIGTLGTSTGVTKTGDNELSLIDLSGEPESSLAANGNANVDSTQQKDSIENDLLSLSMQDQSYGQSGGIALGFGANTNVTGPPLLSSNIQGNSAKEASSSSFPQGASASAVPKPNYDPFSSLTTSSSTSQSRAHTPISAPSSQVPQFKSPSSVLAPFASISSATPHHTEPKGSQNTLFDLNPVQASSTLNASLSASQPANGASNDEDWNFSSALPDEPLSKSSNEISVSTATVGINLRVVRQNQSEPALHITANYSNKSPSAITEYHFQIAVTRGYTLSLKPQSGRAMQPHQRDAITQSMIIHGVAMGQANSVKMRWKASYRLAGDLRQEQGEIPSLGIA